MRKKSSSYNVVSFRSCAIKICSSTTVSQYVGSYFHPVGWAAEADKEAVATEARSTGARVGHGRLL